jgi:hypothetical protein
MRAKPLGYQRSIDLMRVGSCLCKMHTADKGFAHYVVPGGQVAAETAEKIKQHPLVRSGRDGLFPGHDQTWRMLREEDR